MAVITINITQSPIEIIEGLPKTIYISTNIPATTFYTFDGTNPTINSNIAVGGLNLPTGVMSVTFKVFATDGTNTSPIITQIYKNTTISQVRQPRDTVIGLNSPSINNSGIFGSNSPNKNVTYGNTGGITVDAADSVGIPDGYNGTATGTPAGFTDLPQEDYQFIYSTTDKLGQSGKGIGTVPAKITIIVPPSPPEESETNKKLFNPKALLIIQDNTKPNENSDISLLNRPLFSLANPNTTDGIDYTKTGFEGNNITGSFVKQYYNPTDQTLNFYYFDSKALRWIISKEPYVPKNPDIFNLSAIVFPQRGQGSRFVFDWGVFRRRVLP